MALGLYGLAGACHDGMRCIVLTRHERHLSTAELVCVWLGPAQLICLSVASLVSPALATVVCIVVQQSSTQSSVMHCVTH
jgi:hypothetical protein